MASSSAVQVKRSVATEVPTITVLERAQLSGGICKDLLGSDSTFKKVIQNLRGVRARIGGMRLRYSSTGDALEQNVLEQCFILPSEVRNESEVFIFYFLFTCDRGL